MSALKILARCPRRARTNAAIRALNDADPTCSPVRELGPSTPPSRSDHVRRMVRELRIVQLGSITIGDLLARPGAVPADFAAAEIRVALDWMVPR